MKLIRGILLCISMLIASDANNQFKIEAVSFKIYDNALNRVVDKPLNVYGNDMDLFVAVKISQTSDEMKKYRLEVSGDGKGRENDAEGLVEDYHVNRSKNVILYTNEPQFIPFVLDYPCTNEETFVIRLISEEGNEVSKTMINKLTNCYLN